MISCEKAVHLCDKSQYGESSLIEKIKLRYHLFICKTCSSYSSKNSKLTSLCEQAALHNLSEQEKIKMKEQLKGKF